MKTKFNLLWGAAALMMAAITGLHVVAGGQDYVPPLLTQKALNANETGIYYYVWHMATLTMGTIALVFFGAAVRANWRGPAFLVNGLVLAFAGLSVAVGIGFSQFPWALPQWTLFLAVGLTGMAASILPGTSRQARLDRHGG
ncbi:hypothetical protein [Asticcacaulis sp. AC402]|uniref:hypothetical protein n=1 Tax=Asticcacaulis sp. AC402 TaxID=1282361 RepID=UPI0003C3BF9E|nr:hypothetical protein [Asticcacaulis sp. AC402]ESQ74796.1 hypothetical protein ABAC402_12890 [Asticcacaulis sp. AC402]